MDQPTFSQIDTAMSRTCRVQTVMRAAPEVVWALLTNAEAYPSWSTTIVRVEGHVKDGERLRLHVKGTHRTFRPRVSMVVPARSMTWSDGVTAIFKGVRTFTLLPQSNGTTEFTMEETFSGVFFALVKSKMPDFRPIFEAFARDLAAAAERSIERK
jgi:hypothetical protein